MKSSTSKLSLMRLSVSISICNTSLLDTFEGRRMLIAYYFMWHSGHPAPEQCEGCTWVTSQIRELSCIHSRDATFAAFCQGP